MTTTPPRHLSASVSHPGVVRENNEDRVHADDARGIYMVIDGMGGHAAGEHAAEIARDVIKTRLERQTGDTAQRMREAITLANNAIVEAAAKHPDWAGMACVLTAVVIDGAQATVGHVGDSRLYQLRRGRIEKITPDHSPVGEREDRGELTEQEAMRHPRRNEVFRDVGSQTRIPDEAGFIDVLTTPFTADSALLLCSDGLSDSVPAAKILAICEKHAGDLRATLDKLVDAANARGKDNVSIVLVEGPKFAESFGRQRLGENTSRESAGENTGRHAARTRRSVGMIVFSVFAGMLLGALLTFAALHFYPTAPQGPAVWKVTAPATIASVLTQAKSGDRVDLAPGTYRENVALKEGVNLAGTSAIVLGIVSAQNIHQSAVVGLSIEGGVDLTDSAVTLEHCVISGSRESGVRFRGASAGALISNEIRDNAGTGISVEGTSSPELRHNWVIGNGRVAGALKPGLLIAPTARPMVKGNTFANNGAEPLWIPKGRESVAADNYLLPTGALKPFRLLGETPQ
jgi:parallel beta-helix repeat protein